MKDRIVINSNAEEVKCGSLRCCNVCFEMHNPDGDRKLWRRQFTQDSTVRLLISAP